ncbi:MAG TPA: type II toxin-antitoxin system VapC family toxin [Actinomycetes bacterium]
MRLVDVNVLIYAHRLDAPGHQDYADWLRNLLADQEPYGVSDLILSGFLRVVTNPKVFRQPTPPATALAFVEVLRGQPNCVPVAPGQRHWDIFTRLCLAASVKGNLVPDAYLAALAIESGSEWITTDRDFSRFPGLRWRHPLDE